MLRLLGGNGGALGAEVDAGMTEARAALKRVKRKDYYKILEVDRGCDEDELKKACVRTAAGQAEFCAQTAAAVAAAA